MHYNLFVEKALLAGGRGVEPKTLDCNKSSGRVVPIQCVKGDTLKDLDIKDSCFLLMIIYEGSVRFKVRGVSIDAIAPCLVCFDETDSPKLIRKNGLKCDSIYFKPTFLNINMTFSRVHSKNYGQIASLHDMFLLKPFTDVDRYVFPVIGEDVDMLSRLFSLVDTSLNQQKDWYWSCRSRSYFMEMMLLLERAYGLIEQNESVGCANMLRNPHLKKAVIYVENHYSDTVTLKNIACAACLNHSTLTQLFKAELNMTPISYLWYHRIAVAKKFLEFTNLPVGEIASRCGFKTTQHFSRKFEELTGSTPTVFRIDAVAKRKKAF